MIILKMFIDNNRDFLGFLVLEAVDMKIMVFLDVMWSSLVDGMIHMESSFWSTDP